MAWTIVFGVVAAAVAIWIPLTRTRSARPEDGPDRAARRDDNWYGHLMNRTRTEQTLKPMNTLTKVVVQGAACGLVPGIVLLIGGHVSQPVVAAAQVRHRRVADLAEARRFEVLDAAGNTRASLDRADCI